MAGELRTFDDVKVGQKLDTYEYEFTEEDLARFRRVVDDSTAAYCTIAAKEFLCVKARRSFPSGGISAKHEDFYHNPPIPGKRIRSEGWVSDKYQRRGKNFVVVATRSVDEDGRLIVESRHTLVMGSYEKDYGFKKED